MDIVSYLNHKKILVWGYGREGKSSERFIQAHCPSCELEIFEGTGEEIDFDKYDVVFKSPGICTAITNSKITSQTELFLAQFGSQTIGITGTKGKSTTSTLMYFTLSSHFGDKVLLVGNIGLPCLDYYDVIDKDSIIVFELSCHQLNNCKYSPHIAVFLNLFEDHLDYYKTKDKYFQAKAGITANQSTNDYYYCGPNVSDIETKARKTVIEEDALCEYTIPLLGQHNQFNAKVVYNVCSELYHMTDIEIRSAFASFHGLPHRLQFVGNDNGIDFYDDSISTIPEATIQALESVSNAKTVIIGGMDRNIDYSSLVRYIQSHDNITYLFAYPSGKRIYDEVCNLPNCIFVADLAAAVRAAKFMTPQGGACVLSPAAASYGFFKNFEERGDAFKKLAVAGNERQETSIVFTGDIGFDKYMAGQWSNPELLDDDVRKYLKSANHVVVNVEGPLMAQESLGETSGTAQLKHSMSPDVAPFLVDIGADIWSLCNNHIMDAGVEGLKSTLDIAKYYGIRTLGVGMNAFEAHRPVIINEAGGIGMVTVGYQRACRAADDTTPGCYRWDDMAAISNSISDIKTRCRWCILVVHGGEEFTPLPSPYVRERYLKYLDLGADIVVGHHPHVPMNYEMVGNKAIFYSLGNFIFDTDYQRSQHYTDTGVLLKISFTEDAYSLDALGLKINRDTERVFKAPLPHIFTDINDEEYELLAPLSAKAFVEATKRQLRYLYPQEFRDATEEKYIENFFQPLRSGRVPGEVLDMQILYPLSKQAENGDWQKSQLPKVVNYIQTQMLPVKEDANEF